MKFKIALLGLLFFSVTATAAVSIDQLMPIFERTNSESYRPLMCSDTVKTLVKNLKEAGVDLSEAQVYLIRHKGAPHLPILPQKARLRFKDNVYNIPRWGFHVFLEIEGLILDFDYTDDLQIVDALTYH